MISQKVKILNPSGFHLKTATVLSNSIENYSSKIEFQYEKNGVQGTANLKSILSILASGVRQGKEIEICCKGPDEEEALKKVIQTIEDGLGETI